MIKTVLIAGLGGQGVLSAARILGEAAFRRGLPVSVAQLHGMSQRGGAVESTVRFGTESVVATATAPIDVLVSLELLEALRMAERLHPDREASRRGTGGAAGRGSIALINPFMAVPPSAPLLRHAVPSAAEVMTALRERSRVLIVPANELADGVGSRAAANLVMLGAFCALDESPVTIDDLLEAIGRVGGPGMKEHARSALSRGQAAIAG